MSFTGVWRLFRFYEQYPRMHKQLAIAIILSSTFVFWSSGCWKTLYASALWDGWPIRCTPFSLKEKRAGKLMIFLLFASPARITEGLYHRFVPALPDHVPVVCNMSHWSKNKSPESGHRVGVHCWILFSFLTVAQTMQKPLVIFASEEWSKPSKTYQNNFEAQADFATSNFSLGVEFDGTAYSLVKAPAAVVATLFRPCPWGIEKRLPPFCHLEKPGNHVTGIYTLIKVGLRKTFVTIVQAPHCDVLPAIFRDVFTLCWRHRLTSRTLVRYRYRTPFFM